MYIDNYIDSYSDRDVCLKLYHAYFALPMFIIFRNFKIFEYISLNIVLSQSSGNIFSFKIKLTLEEFMSKFILMYKNLLIHIIFDIHGYLFLYCVL